MVAIVHLCIKLPVGVAPISVPDSDRAFIKADDKQHITNVDVANSRRKTKVYCGEMPKFCGKFIDFCGKFTEFRGKFTKFHGKFIEFRGKFIEYKDEFRRCKDKFLSYRDESPIISKQTSYTI